MALRSHGDRSTAATSVAAYVPRERGKGAIMGRRQRVMRWFALAITTMLMAATCTFGEGDTQGDGNGGATDGGPVTLRMWAHRSKSFNKALKDAAAAYTTMHPNVTIELETFAYDSYIQTLQTALPAGTEADILHMFGTWTCTYADNLLPVPEDVISLDEARDTFFPGPLDGNTCDGTLYGLPQESNVEYGAVLFNTAMAREAGVSADGWATWDEFIAEAEAMTKIQDGAVTRAGYHFTAGDGLAHSFLSLILQAGGNYLNEDGTAFTLDTPEGAQALTLLKSMADAPVIDPVLFNDEQNWVGDCYFTEQCAMGLVGPWAVADYASDYPEVVADTVYAELPPLEESRAFVADSGWGLTVSTHSPNADVAWDFAAFAALDPQTAAEWNLASGTLPALLANAEGAARDELISAFPHFDTWFEVLPNAQFVGQLPDRDLLYYEIIYNHGLAALQGEETVDEALKAMETEANETFG
jgi:multiple sugar transport system substrate-binding protein